MKKPKITLTKRRIYFGLLGLLVLANFAATVWLYLDNKNTKKDLYAVRDDYYGNTEYGKQRMFNEDPYSIKQEEIDDSWTPDFDILSQEVKTMETYDGYNNETGTDIYEDSKVRVVKVKITNDTQSLYSYYEGDLGYTDENGRVIRSISVSQEDDLNQKTSNIYGGTLELAPDGTAEMYIYFIDNGEEITEISSLNYGV